MIKDLFSQKQTLSFEVFPPKKDDEFTNAQNVLHQLSELQPDFISVTYGAGGTTKGYTVKIAPFQTHGGAGFLHPEQSPHSGSCPYDLCRLLQRGHSHRY